MASASSNDSGDGGDGSWQWTEELYHHKPWWNKPSAYEERGLEFEDFMERTRQQNEEGLPVQLEVPAFTWKSHKNWDLLMIICKPLAGFKHRSSMAKTVKLYGEGWRYHISLCFVKELPEDGGWEAYQRIREKFDNKRGTLMGNVKNAEYTLLAGKNDFTDAIVHDPDVDLLHKAGDYKTRNLHVST